MLGELSCLGLIHVHNKHRQILNTLNRHIIRENIPLPTDDDCLFYKIKREKLKIEKNKEDKYIIVQIIEYNNEEYNLNYAKINSIFVI